MKLTSILKPNVAKLSPEDIKTTVISKDCTLSQAFVIIENWCADNDADYPHTYDVWKMNGKIQVSVKTRDKQFINIFDIED